MSHGNVIEDVGTCEACGQEMVALHPSTRFDERLGRRLLTCVDEFRCFAAWQANR